MRTIPMHFRFKGERNYIHGTDIYNEMVSHIKKNNPLKQIQVFQLSLHKYIYNQCHMILGKPGEMIPKPKNACCELIIKKDQGQLWAWLVETDELINKRYDFNVESIKKLCTIDDKKIMIKGESGYSPIEVTSTMTKELHNYLFYEEGIKWALTRLELSRILKKEDSSKIIIDYKHGFNNLKLTKSFVYSGNELIGSIYFTRIK